MPTVEGVKPSHHEVNYRQKYKLLKRKMKFLIYEQECFTEELRRSQRKLLKVSRDKSFLLDRLLQYEKADASSDDSDKTDSSEDEPDGTSRKNKSRLSQQMPVAVNSEGSTITVKQEMVAMPSSSESLKKTAKSSVRKAMTIGSRAGLKHRVVPKTEVALSREEIERQLDSKPEQPSYMQISKASVDLPSDIFNDSSNADSELTEASQNLVLDMDKDDNVNVDG